MREDMISNGLVWLLAKIVNFISSGDDIVFGDYDSPQGSSSIVVSQQTLLQRWHELKRELEVWFKGLPDVFAPCARIEPPAPSSSSGVTFPFAEIWCNIPMCASALQHYHYACILLLINKPHESTALRSTITGRLKSYLSIADEIKYHSREICGISLSRPEGSVRIHALQPLFVAGQCLTDPCEREIALKLIRGIQTDLGLATEYRAKQLLKEWNLQED